MYDDYKFKKQGRNILRKLDRGEKKLIMKMMQAPDKTLELPMNTGTIVKLTNYNIIGRAASNHITNGFNPTFPYFLQPWVVDAINKTPKIIE